MYIFKTGRGFYLAYVSHGVLLKVRFLIFSSVFNLISAVRNLANRSLSGEAATRSQWKVHIVSKNSFPTKAGLASSASGYACLGSSVFFFQHLDALQGYQLLFRLTSTILNFLTFKLLISSVLCRSQSCLNGPPKPY